MGDRLHFPAATYQFPQLLSPFPFEQGYDDQGWKVWFQTHWVDSLYYSFVYVVLVFIGTWMMSTREKFDLRRVLGVWSMCLAGYSILGSIRYVPEFVDTLYNKGLTTSVCDTRIYDDKIINFYSMTFALSKVFELGDTFFIIARKQKLIFLHWYHHVTVLIFCFCTYRELTPNGRWFCCMNFVVHSFMYSYFTLRAFQVRVPKWVNLFITSLQISQMVVGLFVCFYSWYLLSIGQENCPNNKELIIGGAAMYMSYFVLFGNFFYNTYIKPKPRVLEQKDVNDNAVATASMANGTQDTLRHRNV